MFVVDAGIIELESCGYGQGPRGQSFPEQKIREHQLIPKQKIRLWVSCTCRNCPISRAQILHNLAISVQAVLGTDFA